MGNPDGCDRQAVGLERSALDVLAEVERVEHAREAQLLAESSQLFLATGRQPQLGRRDFAARAEHRAERPRDQVSPVVEMEVRDHDRVDARPGLLLAQTG